MKTIKDLNKIAKVDGLELIKDNGYFYWWGLTDEMQDKCASMQTTAVYTCHFNQAKFDYWLRELGLIKKAIEENEAGKLFKY